MCYYLRMVKNTESQPKPHSKLKKAGIAGVALLALGGSFVAGRNTVEQHTDTQAEGQDASNLKEMIVTAELIDKSPVTILNGSLVETRADGSVTSYDYPIVTFSGDPDVTGRSDVKNFHYFTATQANGVPTVTEITVSPSMTLVGDNINSDIETLDAILAPIDGSESERAPLNAYYVQSFPKQLLNGEGGGKGGLLIVATPPTELAPALVETAPGN